MLYVSVNGVCDPPTWRKYSQKNLPYGTAVITATLEECQSNCIANSLCTGLAWNPLLAVKCWLQGTWSGNTMYAMYEDPNVDYYKLIRNSTCTGTLNAVVEYGGR